MANEFKIIPTEICLEAKQFMKYLLQQLKDNGVMITSLDHAGLYLIAWTFHSFVKATKTIESEGSIIKERNNKNTTILKPHPAKKMQYDANAQLTKLLIEYGLTPRARGRVDATQGDLFESPPELRKFEIVK